jgi:hypothetical protein
LRAHHRKVAKIEPGSNPRTSETLLMAYVFQEPLFGHHRDAIMPGASELFLGFLHLHGTTWG